MASKPKWSQDEWIVALDYYLRRGGKVPGSKHPEIKELSATLRRLCGVIEDDPITKGPNGVAMQLATFKSLDPEYEGEGLRAGQRAREVWGLYADNPAMVRRLAKAILDGVDDLEKTDEAQRIQRVEDIYGVAEAKEGILLTRKHIHRERKPGLVKRKKADHLKEHGTLSCVVCDFDYFKIYGPHGDGYIECHHTTPLSALSSPRVNRLTDLVLICASCHRMIHRKKEWLEVEQLRAMWEGRPYEHGDRATS